MPKYTHFKYASTRKFYLKYYRKTCFEKYDGYDGKHKDSKEKQSKIDFVCPFCKRVFECSSAYGGHMSSHRKEPDFLKKLDKAKKERYDLKNDKKHVK